MYTQSVLHHDVQNEILERLSKNWNERVAVRKERLNLDQYYDPKVPDFPIAMVPFWTDDLFLEASEFKKQKVLAGAWISYNEKTIYIEEMIINPLCALLLRGELPGVSDPTVKQVLAQTQVDEQFHILMCLEVCNCARRRHDMQGFVMSEPLIGKRLKEMLESSSDEQDHALIRLAYGTVAEMTINAYLKQLSSDESIQPLNRLNTELHRRDEGAHAAIFGEIVPPIYKSLSESRKDAFKYFVIRALKDFVEIDVSFWGSILNYVDIENGNKITEKLKTKSSGKRSARDYTSLRKLLNQIGIDGEVSFDFNL